MVLVGQRIRRVEDPELVTGRAKYVGDVASPAIELVFVRSTIAHAGLAGIDTSGALAAPGVVAVMTFDDVSSIPAVSPVPVPDAALRPPLAHDVTRFVGEPIVAIAAETLTLAVDAAELVVIDYDPLPAVVDVEAAMRPDAPLLFPTLGSNVITRVDKPSVELHELGDVVIDVWFDNQRLAVAPLEPNNILADPRPDGSLVVHVSTQSPHAVRDAIAGLLNIEPAKVRVIAPAVGGGFGAKSLADAEYQIACLLALRLKRPVRWRQSRTENLLTQHGRSQRQHVRLAARRDGTLTAIEAEIIGDGGAYPAINAYLAFGTARMLSGVYAFASVTSSPAAVATNTAPPTAYRGAGRPEAACLVERAVDIMAGELGLDPVEIRQRNFISPDRFPYTTPTGAVYDVGDYDTALRKAVAVSGYERWRAEQDERRARGDQRLLGIGIATYVEITAGFGETEFADVEVHDDARVSVKVGTFGHGQGHKTTYAQIAADVLQIGFDQITVIDGDTSTVKRGGGTFSSRSIQVGGTAVHVASTQVVERARLIAADILEAAVDDIVAVEGGFAVAGVPARRKSWAEIAVVAQAQRVDDGVRSGLFAEVDWQRPNATFPFGAHVAVVEIDRETGRVELIEHTAIDDCGTIINPLLADGQVHGGVAQGAAQALLEQVVYDGDGNLVTSNLADYAFISAAELPSFAVDHTVTPTYMNPLGAKGIGESGTIGATAAVHNAVLDALSPFGVRHLDMPCTPVRVWTAINGQGDNGRLTVWRK